MSILTAEAYLSFDGTADAAIALYQRALGAEVERILRYGDYPELASMTSHTTRVMHAVLRIGASRVLLNDVPPGTTVPRESNIRVTLELDDPNDAAVRFDALAAGGTVRFPFDDMSGGKLGSLTDAYGISWTFHCPAKSA
ncbi:VOC family protein [Sandaracinus amylolyticus]|uniref:VOC family protein n=1 Tax=Sandaracinus amylolyticus TaxID=927083 RepID=UPI001F4162F4|nr:glyoxalase/bleomycin resistance/extradiol dioxygenase family protein [Sandaracinus amylolyticus]UJR81109.1 3-demethylubiquinone-9 3-methyltransferase [Sandaracinus amylolyticus]